VVNILNQMSNKSELAKGANEQVTTRYLAFLSFRVQDQLGAEV